MSSTSSGREERSLINRILYRVRHGARILPLARHYGIKPYRLYREAKARGIKLCPGYEKWFKTPQHAAQYLNREFGPYSSTKFRRLRFTRSLAEIGKTFGRSHQWAFEVDHALFRGVPKPNPQQILLEKRSASGLAICLEILGRAGFHVRDAAQVLHWSEEIIYGMNRRFHFGLETNFDRRQRLGRAWRQCALMLREKGFNAGEIARILKRNEMSIRRLKSKSRRLGLALPFEVERIA